MGATGRLKALASSGLELAEHPAELVMGSEEDTQFGDRTLDLFALVNPRRKRSASLTSGGIRC